MFEILENLSIPAQLGLLAGFLLFLFILVRLNTKNNRKKRVDKRTFGDRLKAERKKKEDSQH